MTSRAMDPSMKVVVGIGNPGREYKGTRHNVGFDVVEALGRADGIEIRKKSCSSLVGEGKVAGRRVLLVKPQTYVNNSGVALRQVLDFRKMSVDDLLVVCDDANLPLGKLRFRREGSAGGHHGLESIIAHLGTDTFQRLRVGIGRREGDLVDHVLSRFSRAERKLMDETCIEAIRAVTIWLLSGIDECMNEFNG